MNASIIISLLALLVSFYRIFERQRAAYSTLRVRLTELLDEIEDLNIEDLRYRDQVDAGAKDGAGDSEWTEPPKQASYGYASRRALLTYQAVDLLNCLGKARIGPNAAVTPAEYCSLAISLRWCGDDALAITNFQAALSVKDQFLPPAVLRASSIGLGETLFADGRLEEARDCFARAAVDDADETLWDTSGKFFVCLRWLACEKREKGGRPEIPARRAYEIAAKTGEWGPEPLEALREACRDTICVNGTYAEVNLDDLLKYSLAELLAGAGP